MPHQEYQRYNFTQTIDPPISNYGLDRQWAMDTPSQLWADWQHTSLFLNILSHENNKLIRISSAYYGTQYIHLSVSLKRCKADM